MKKVLLFALAILLVGALFISCGKKAADEVQTPAPTTQAATPTATAPAATPAAPAVPPAAPAVTPAAPAAPAAPAVEEKVVFKMVNGAEPESLDPHQIQGVPEHRLYTAIFEGLVVYNPEDASTIPGLAESWTVDESGTVYTFKLRDASWSDGVKITAQTFVDSWLRILNPATAAPYAWFPAMFLKGAAEYNAGEAGSESVAIKALDDHTFQMELVGPLPYAIGALAHYSFAVVPMHAIEKYGDKWINPENFVGNGPFVLKEWVPQSLIRVAKNDKYWDADAVKLDEVIFYATDDNNTAYNMFLNGEVDWINTVPLDQLEAASLRKDFHRAPMLTTYYYVFQTEKAPFDDVRVRQAFALAFDRQALVDQVTKGGEIPAWGIVPDMAGYEALARDPMLDVAEAKKLLAAAGYPNGVGFPKTSVVYNTSETHRDIAQFLQDEWKKNLNVTVELENQEWATYLSSRNEGTFQVARAGWSGDYQDPNTFLDMFVTGTAMNGGKYANPQYDLLIEQAAYLSGQDRMDVMKEAEYLLVTQDQAIVNMYYYTTKNMIDTGKWGGWYTNTMDIHPVKNIYLK